MARVTLRRAIFVALALAMLALSWARMSNTELRRATKAIVAREAAAPLSTRPTMGASGGGSSLKVARVIYMAVLPVFLLRPASLLTPASRPSGSDALGTSVPRSKRWAVLGGHGRLGAG